MGRVLVAVLIFIAIVGILVFIFSKGKKIIINKNIMFLAGDRNIIDIYTMDDENKIVKDKEVNRGTKVTAYNDKLKDNDIEYTKIEYDNNNYYVNTNALVKNIKDVVLEKERYIRTSVTVYENENDSKIKSFIKKGNRVEVLGYDKLLEDGNVNMYKIKYNDSDGWVYSKYLVDSEDSAKEVYNVDGIYDIHKDRKFKGRELYGGKASTLDYYPYERVEFDNNKLLRNAKSMYLNAGVIGSIDSYLKISKDV